VFSAASTYIGAGATAAEDADTSNEEITWSVTNSTASSETWEVTFSDYDDGEGNIVNGSMTLTESIGSSSVSIHEAGTLVTINGASTENISFNINGKVTESTIKIGGTFTVNGTEYSFSESEASSSIAPKRFLPVKHQ